MYFLWQLVSDEPCHYAVLGRSITHHPAVVHGSLCFASALGTLPPLRVPLRSLPDLKNVCCGSGAAFSPVRCRTHAYASTMKTTPDRKKSRTVFALRQTCYFFPVKDRRNHALSPSLGRLTLSLKEAARRAGGSVSASPPQWRRVTFTSEEGQVLFSSPPRRNQWPPDAAKRSSH